VFSTTIFGWFNVFNVESKQLMFIFCLKIYWRTHCDPRLIKKRISRRNERNKRRWAGKERQCSCERNIEEKKTIVSDKLLKYQFQIELEVTKGLMAQKPKIGKRYKSGKNFIGKGAGWQLQWRTVPCKRISLVFMASMCN